MVGDLLALDPAFLDRREVVGGGPERGVELLVEQVVADLQRLEGGGVVGEILVEVAVEVVGADVDRQVLAPVVGVAAVLDRLAGLDVGDDVLAGADRRHQRRVGEFDAGVVVLGQDRQAAGELRQVAGRGAGLEGELDAVRVERLDRLDVLERDLVGGLALLQEHLPGEDDVVGGDRHAVGEFRLRAAG